MDDDKKAQWEGRKSGRRARWEAKELRSKMLERDPVGAHVEYASRIYTLAGRPWCVWMHLDALQAAKDALVANHGGFVGMTPNQVNIVTTILVSVPSWLGGDARMALVGLGHWLASPERSKILEAHTVALLWITMGRAYSRLPGKEDEARACYRAVRALRWDIAAQKTSIAQHQLIRVLRDVGLYFRTHTPREQVAYKDGTMCISDALKLAKELGARDQVMKIRLRCWRRRVWVW